jgi:signal transduction histidine kinase
VEEGIIRHINPAAASLLLSEGMAVEGLIASALEEYAQLSEGCLHLQLYVNQQCIDATVICQESGRLFLPDTMEAFVQFQNLSLTALQLREPLTALMAINEHILPSANPEYAAMANRRLHQMLRIIGNMSDAPRYTNPDRCHKEYTEICGFLEELLEKADGLMQHIGIRIQSNIPRENIYTLVDREQLERAVYNLLSNAAKFGQSSDIHVQLVRRGKKLYLSVQSSGAASDAGSFYDRFLREPTLEGPAHGSGLGMVIIRSVAVNHGGAVLIDHPDREHTRITMSFAINHGKDNMVRSPIGGFDYAGEQDHGLLELADVLPAKLYTME